MSLTRASHAFPRAGSPASASMASATDLSIPTERSPLDPSLLVSEPNSLILFLKCLKELKENISYSSLTFPYTCIEFISMFLKFTCLNISCLHDVLYSNALFSLDLISQDMMSKNESPYSGKKLSIMPLSLYSNVMLDLISLNMMSQNESPFGKKLSIMIIAYMHTLMLLYSCLHLYMFTCYCPIFLYVYVSCLYSHVYIL